MKDYISQLFINPRDPLVQYYRNEFGPDWQGEYFAYISKIVEKKRENRRKFFKKILGFFANNSSGRERLNQNLVA